MLQYIIKYFSRMLLFIKYSNFEDFLFFSILIEAFISPKIEYYIFFHLFIMSLKKCPMKYFHFIKGAL